MPKRTKKTPTPTVLLRTWLIVGCVSVAAMLAGAGYLRHLVSSVNPQATIETASLREYREKRLPLIEAAADRQELADELERCAAKTERILQRAASVEANAVSLMEQLPRFVTLGAGLFFFVFLLGYGYLRAMNNQIPGQNSQTGDGNSESRQRRPE